MRLFLLGLYVWSSLVFDRLYARLYAIYALIPAGAIYLIICVIYFAHKRAICADLY